MKFSFSFEFKNIFASREFRGKQKIYRAVKN